MTSQGQQNGGLDQTQIQPVQSVAPTDPRLRKRERRETPPMYTGQSPAQPCSSLSALGSPLPLPDNILMPPPPPPPLTTSNKPSMHSSAHFSVPPGSSMAVMPLNVIPDGPTQIRFDASVPPPAIIINSACKRINADFSPVGPCQKIRKTDDHLPDTPCEQCFARQQRSVKIKQECENFAKQIKLKNLLYSSKLEETSNMKSIVQMMLPAMVSSAIDKGISGNNKSASTFSMELSQTEEMFARFLLNTTSDNSPLPEHSTNGALADIPSPSVSLNGFSQFVTGLKNDGIRLPALSTLENIRAAYINASGSVLSLPALSALAAVSTPTGGPAAVSSPVPASAANPVPTAAAAATVTAPTAAVALTTPTPALYAQYQPNVPPPTLPPANFTQFPPIALPPPYAHFQAGVPPPAFASQQPPPPPPFANQEPPSPYPAPQPQPPQAMPHYAMQQAPLALPPYHAPQTPLAGPPFPMPQQTQPPFAPPPQPQPQLAGPPPPYAAPQPQPPPPHAVATFVAPQPPRPSSPYGAQHAYYPHPNFPTYQ